MSGAKTYHFPTAISVGLAIYRAVLAVAASVLAVYSVCIRLIQRCISCISELLHYVVDAVGEILAKHVTF